MKKFNLLLGKMLKYRHVFMWVVGMVLVVGEVMGQELPEFPKDYLLKTNYITSNEFSVRKGNDSSYLKKASDMEIMFNKPIAIKEVLTFLINNQVEVKSLKMVWKDRTTIYQINPLLDIDRNVSILQTQHLDLLNLLINRNQLGKDIVDELHKEVNFVKNNGIYITHTNIIGMNGSINNVIGNANVLGITTKATPNTANARVEEGNECNFYKPVSNIKPTKYKSKWAPSQGNLEITKEASGYTYLQSYITFDDVSGFKYPHTAYEHEMYIASGRDRYVNNFSSVPGTFTSNMPNPYKDSPYCDSDETNRANLHYGSNADEFQPIEQGKQYYFIVWVQPENEKNQNTAQYWVNGQLGHWAGTSEHGTSIETIKNIEFTSIVPTPDEECSFCKKGEFSRTYPTPSGVSILISSKDFCEQKSNIEPNILEKYYNKPAYCIVSSTGELYGINSYLLTKRYYASKPLHWRVKKLIDDTGTFNAKTYASNTDKVTTESSYAPNLHYKYLINPKLSKGDILEVRVKKFSSTPTKSEDFIEIYKKTVNDDDAPSNQADYIVYNVTNPTQYNTYSHTGPFLIIFKSNQTTSPTEIGFEIEYKVIKKIAYNINASSLLASNSFPLVRKEATFAKLTLELCNPNPFTLKNVPITITLPEKNNQVVGTATVDSIPANSTVTKTIEIDEANFVVDKKNTLLVKAQVLVNGVTQTVVNDLTSFVYLGAIQKYVDVPPTYLYFPFIGGLDYFGATTGYTNGSGLFGVVDGTRAWHFSAWITRLKKVPLNTTANAAVDITGFSLTSPEAQYLLTAANLGAFKNFGRVVKPNEVFSKADAMRMLVNLYSKDSDFVGIETKPFADVTVTNAADKTDINTIIAVGKKIGIARGKTDGNFGKPEPCNRNLGAKYTMAAHFAYTSSLNDFDNYPDISSTPLPADITFTLDCKTSYLAGEEKILYATFSGRTEGDLNLFFRATAGTIVGNKWIAPKVDTVTRVVIEAVVTNGKNRVSRFTVVEVLPTPADDNTTPDNPHVIEVSDVNGLIAALLEAEKRIKAGLDSVDVWVAPGTYELKETLKIPDGVRLIAMGCNPALTILKAMHFKDVVEMKGGKHGALIGFTVLGDQKQGQFAGVNVGGNVQFLLKNCIITSVIHGVRTDGNTTLDMLNCNVYKFTGDGVGSNGVGSAKGKITVKNCIFLTEKNSTNIAQNGNSNTLEVAYNNSFGQGKNNYITGTNLNQNPNLDAQGLSALFNDMGEPLLIDDDGSRSNIGAGEASCVSISDSPSLPEPPTIILPPKPSFTVSVDTTGGKNKVKIVIISPETKFVLKVGDFEIELTNNKTYEFEGFEDMKYLIQLFAISSTGVKSEVVTGTAVIPAKNIKKPDVPTGLEELELFARQISVFPNPSNDYFTLKIDIPTEDLIFSVKNMLGQQIDFSKTVIDNQIMQINLNNVAVGFYTLEITKKQANGKTITIHKKLMKQ